MKYLIQPYNQGTAWEVKRWRDDRASYESWKYPGSVSSAARLVLDMLTAADYQPNEIETLADVRRELVQLAQAVDTAVSKIVIMLEFSQEFEIKMP